MPTPLMPIPCPHCSGPEGRQKLAGGGARNERYPRDKNNKYLSPGRGETTGGAPATLGLF